ncbi:hypothetical protein CRYUN_Cryun01aG0102100 [Craigia yunnanensis]
MKPSDYTHQAHFKFHIFSSRNCTVGGYNVPSETMVMVKAWAIQRDPYLWHDPTSFKHERFEGEESNKLKLMASGLKRRACPRAGLAQIMVGFALGSLIQCFGWKRFGKKEVDIGEGGGVSMPKAEPLEAMCKARPIVNINKVLLSRICLNLFK